jgi:triosephosphate isomerase
MKRTKYTIANWKMNGQKDSYKLVKSISNYCQKMKRKTSKVVICPPFTLLSELIKKEKKIKFGGQDCHYKSEGAYTGSISANMLKTINCQYVILGHSERRIYQKETSQELNLKIQSAIESNLTVIYCIGEKLEEIKKRNIILKKQLSSLPKKIDPKKIIIAYEPVWAIGTGKVPSLNDINKIHEKIRHILSNLLSLRFSKHVSILYGGSVNAVNSVDILNLDHVDGALVGGASLKSKEFCKIIDSYH